MEPFRDEIRCRSVVFPKGALHLHVMPVAGGIETRRVPGYDFNGLERGSKQFRILQYTLEGEGALIFEGKRHRLLPGDAMLLSVPQDHRYFLPPESHSWKFIHLSFQGVEALRIWDSQIAPAGPVLKLPLNSHTVRKLFETVSILLGRQTVSPCAASALAYSFLMEFASELGAASGSSGENRFVEKAEAFCMEHFPEDITAGDMADAAGCSRCYFTRLFRRVKGVPPARFLRELRLANAFRLLQFERMSVKQIAAECGFFDESHFCRTFRSKYGVTPDAFRFNR